MQISDQIIFSNLNNKSILQVEIFEKASENKTVRVETYWRNGLFKITFMHDYEIDAFKEILDGGDEYELETDDFEFCEMLETYDSQSKEIDDKWMLTVWGNSTADLVSNSSTLASCQRCVVDP